VNSVVPAGFPAGAHLPFGKRSVPGHLPPGDALAAAVKLCLRVAVDLSRHTLASVPMPGCDCLHACMGIPVHVNAVENCYPESKAEAIRRLGMHTSYKVPVRIPHKNTHNRIRGRVCPLRFVEALLRWLLATYISRQ
jgi:hypothetical protein